jgi:ABC-2 type transport system permease protein
VDLGWQGIEAMIGRPIYAVMEREVLRMFRQKTRLVSAMVRPLIWLFVIGAGFDTVIGESGGIPYQTFLIPGVIGMTMLFGAMLAALTTVYDKESGVMRMMIIAPLPHYWIVIAKVLSAALAAILQALLLAILLALLGYLTLDTNFPLLALGLVTTSLACAGIGIVTASFTRSLDNFAAIMNFVIFPVFFLSGSLYPVQKLPELLRWVATINPYTYGVDLLKHATVTAGAMSADFTLMTDIVVLVGFTLAAVLLASWRFSRETAYEPMIHVLTGKRR